MKLKVLKNINCYESSFPLLQEGDILDYDKEKHDFYIDKEEEIVENGVTINRPLRINVSKWSARAHQDCFVFIDKKGKEFVYPREYDVHYTDFPGYKPDPEEIIEPMHLPEDALEPILTPQEALLIQENKELKEELEKLKNENKEIKIIKKDGEDILSVDISTEEGKFILDKFKKLESLKRMNKYLLNESPIIRNPFILQFIPC